uniref:Uncharacterized protein n=1 Tax=Janibacter limosus TaxID=53458 RepID=A0AC61U5F3_9MICO|nr:hypothetical protein [Janibacter limosus]
MQSSASSLSLARWKTPPPKPGKDGKLSAALDAVDVHVLDAGLGLVATGDHVLVADRLGAEVLGLTARDRVDADVGEELTLVLPVWLPSAVVMICGPEARYRSGRRSAHTRGCSITWSSTETICMLSRSGTSILLDRLIVHLSYIMFIAETNPTDKGLADDRQPRKLRSP